MSSVICPSKLTCLSCVFYSFKGNHIMLKMYMDANKRESQSKKNTKAGETNMTDDGKHLQPLKLGELTSYYYFLTFSYIRTVKKAHLR